jgi:hypothetical protein
MHIPRLLTYLGLGSSVTTRPLPGAGGNTAGRESESSRHLANALTFAGASGLNVSLHPETFADSLGVSSAAWEPAWRNSNSPARSPKEKRVPKEVRIVRSHNVEKRGARLPRAADTHPVPGSYVEPPECAGVPRVSESGAGSVEKSRCAAHEHPVRAPMPRARVIPNNATAVIEPFRYADRDVPLIVSMGVSNALAQLSSICREGSSTVRKEAWDVMHRETRDKVSRHVQAQAEIWGGDRNLSNDQVNEKLNVLARGANAQSSRTFSTLDQMCAFKLVLAVESEIVKKEKERQPRSPVEFLHVLSKHQHRPLAVIAGADGRLNPAIDQVLLTAARILYCRFGASADLKCGRFFDADADRVFMDALEKDLAKNQLAAKLIPEAAPAYENSPFWFDGSAVRGAMGMTASDMAKKITGSLSLSEKIELVRLRLRQLQENADYVMGTPQQSYATVILRVGPIVGVSTAELADSACLIDRFQALTDATQATKAYPVSPLLLAADHTVRSAGVLSSRVLNKEELLTRELCTVKLNGMLALTEEQLQRRNASMVADETDSRVPFRCDRVAVSARSGGSLSGTIAETQAVAEYRKLEASREIITADSAESLNRKKLAYLNEREAAYEPMPVFDESVAAARLMLGKLYMPTCDVSKRRGYIYTIMDTSRRPFKEMNVVGIASPLEEFFLRRSLAYSGQQTLYFGDRSLDTVTDLDNARRQFEETLHLHEITIAKAKEALRLIGLPLTSASVDQVARALAKAAVGQPNLQKQRAELIVDLVKQSLDLSGTTSHDGVLDAFDRVYDVLSQYNTEEIVELLPVVGSSYTITKGLWRRDGGQVINGVARLGVDAALIWLGSRLNVEAAAALEQEITEVRPAARITPATSMLRNHYTEMHGVSLSVLPSGVEGAIEDGSSRTFELHYAEPGEGATLMAGNARPPPKQYGYRPPGADGLEPSRSVHDVSRVMQSMKEAEASAVPGSAVFGIATCLPTMLTVPKSAPAVSDMNDLLLSADERARAMIQDLVDVINQSPTGRRLVRYGRAMGIEPFTVAVAEADPVTFQAVRKISVPSLEWIEGKTYMSATGKVQIQSTGIILHEWMHSVLGYTENVGADADLERGGVTTFTNQIGFESNLQYPDRTLYGNAASGSGGPPLEKINAARIRALKQDREMAPLFNYAHEPDLKILGTRAKERDTVKAMKDVAKDLSNARAWYWMGSKSDGAKLAQAMRTRTLSGASTVDAENFNTVFDDLNTGNVAFRGMIARWLSTQKPAEPWTFIFNVPRTSGQVVSPWSVNRNARTVSFFAGPTFYSSPFGPAVASMERRVVGAIVELANEAQWPPMGSTVAQLNRGHHALMTDLILGARLPTRAVSGEFAVDPEILWNNLSHAAKAADQEDVLLERAIQRMDSDSRAEQDAWLFGN